MYTYTRRETFLIYTYIYRSFDYRKQAFFPDFPAETRLGSKIPYSSSASYIYIYTATTQTYTAQNYSAFNPNKHINCARSRVYIHTYACDLHARTHAHVSALLLRMHRRFSVRERGAAEKAKFPYVHTHIHIVNLTRRSRISLRP